ncbi:MAG: rhodanese-like domain-containing protein [Gammaproteobacteria bacterium]|nr:rhodanese-like domain-containing protein [Gammaproteobacteria bacterium]
MRAVSLILLILGTTNCMLAVAEEKPAKSEPVGITSSKMAVTVTHRGKSMQIVRNPNNANTVKADYAITSRACPPFCILPMELAPGIETIGELEMLNYLVGASNSSDILVIDSRTSDWVAKGTIPGSISIPWTLLNLQTSDPLTISDIMESKFGAVQMDELWDFDQAKTLVLFCNGMWCGQSPRNIRTLLRYGFPAENIKWYRGGMQTWEVLGLTTVPGGPPDY